MEVTDYDLMTARQIKLENHEVVSFDDAVEVSEVSDSLSVMPPFEHDLGKYEDFDK